MHLPNSQNTNWYESKELIGEYWNNKTGDNHENHPVRTCYPVTNHRVGKTKAHLFLCNCCYLKEINFHVDIFSRITNITNFLNEILSCPHERNNVFDIFAVKCEKWKNFACIYFRESITSKLFAESYFCEFGQKQRKLQTFNLVKVCRI